MEDLHPTVNDIEEEYRQGNLQEVEEDLFTFLNERREKVLNMWETLQEQFSDREINLAFAAKSYILQIRSINSEHEIRKELKDIEREVQRRKSNRNEPVDREEVVQEWCDRYAPSWRDRHVMTVIYVFEQNREKYLSVIREAE